ncbi:MAG TPA: hypothetical protein VGP61_11310 [Gemmatimonadales bacterium]|nr:hypothetical protein [Gemmatimonadales bacterium]
MKAGALAAGGLAAAVALPSLRNGFVYDDVLVIVQNPLVHGLSHSATIWHASYWPAGLLYRPLSIQLFALEWAGGSGAPLVFHAVSALLYGVVTLLLFRLARRIFSRHEYPSRTLGQLGVCCSLTTLLFAVHPVHTEVFANVVGQAELLVACFALLAVERYLAWRALGPLTTAQRLALAGLTLLGILAKETGYVIPLLLGAAELSVVRSPRKGLAETVFLQAAVVAGALLWRASVLGSVTGESPAAVFAGLGFAARAIALLAVVPQWARLLLWPAHLQAEYGPPGLPLTASLGAPQLTGLGILLLAVVLLLWNWRRNPIAAFGLLWALLALAPVSNLAAPTGILLAERVLFLPSVGVVLALGAALAAWLPRVEVAGRRVRLAAGIAAAALLLLAAARSFVREAVWRSQESFFAALERDAPRSYRAHFVTARYAYGERRFPEAERAAREALALYAGDPQVHEQLGQVLRAEGRCAEALPVLAEGVRLAPERTTTRSRLIECALAVGDTARARAVAREAVRLGQQEFNSTLRRLGGRE